MAAAADDETPLGTIIEETTELVDDESGDVEDNGLSLSSSSSDPRRSKRDRKPPPRPQPAGGEVKKPAPAKKSKDGAGGGAASKSVGGSEDDLFLQKAVVNRIVKAALPPGIQVGKEAKTALAYAGKVWISYLTAAANDFCQQANRSTVTPNDVFRALNELEFEEFMPPLKELLSARTADKLAKKKATAPAQ